MEKCVISWIKSFDFFFKNKLNYVKKKFITLKDPNKDSIKKQLLAWKRIQLLMWKRGVVESTKFIGW